MDKPVSIFKFSLSPGVILGVILVLFSVILYIMEVDLVEAKWINPVNWAISAIIFYVYQKNYRDNFNSGLLSLGEAIKIGVTIAVIASLFSSVYSFIFMTYLEPGFIDQTLLKVEEQMLEQNPEMTQQQVDMALGMTKKFMNPAISIPMAIVFSAISGLILSLITGLFLKRGNAPV